ncbi:hypothetical protein EPN54_01465 [bacterium]|nr:MAG: hypothetical protein EPN54_01465 [bacterium]
MRNIDVSSEDLRKFALRVFIALFLTGTVLFFKHKEIHIWFYSAGILFLSGLFKPTLIKPAYSICMRSALVLEWVITRPVMLTVFYLLFTPFALVIRLFRADPLDRKIEKNKKSYWKEKINDPPGWERQF